MTEYNPTVDDPDMNRRKLSSIFAQPREQIRLVMGIVLIWAAIVVGCLVLFLQNSRQSLLTFGNQMNISSDFLLVVENSYSTSILAVVALIGVMSAMLAMWLLALSHRVYGPTVQIKRVLTELRAGNYSIRGKLRKGDSFQDVMDDLNSFAEELERKKL